MDTLKRSIHSSLAVKITLPFVALFAAVLLALGLMLAREILAEVEARVEDQQRFVLEVATFPGFALGEENLRQIRDRAARLDQGGLRRELAQRQGRELAERRGTWGSARAGATPGASCFGAANSRASSAKGEFVVLEEGGRTLSTIAREDHAAWPMVEALAAAVRTGQLKPADENIQRATLRLAGRNWLVLFTARPARGPGAVMRRFYLLYPFAEIENAQNRALRRIAAFGGVGLALVAGLGLLIAHWIAAPVRRLAAAAKRISLAGLGESSALPAPRQPGERGDEIAELTRAFEAMVETLRNSQAELLKSERLAATGKLAASVAHEIRNPLTSLRMTVEMLQQRAGNSDPQTQQAYGVLLGEINRLALAVEELLTFAQPRPPQRVPTDLNQLAAETLKFLELQLQHARITGRLEPDGTLPPDLPLDPEKIRQLLVNLLLNAQQAMVRDGAVTVRTHWDASRRQATLAVSDTGPGIAEEVRGELFELFVSTKGSGGLGLAIAKQIAEEHGGGISFETSPHGTTFTVILGGL